MTSLKFFLFILSAIFISHSVSADEWPTIELAGIDLSTAKRIQVEEDPVYKTAKDYEAIPLAQVLSRFSETDRAAKDRVVVFVAKDGYSVSMALADAMSEHGYIAFRDIEAPSGKKWMTFKFGKETTTPAPFYLVWPKQGLDKWRYPWPFQLASISLQPASTYFGAAAPAKKTDDIRTGFNLFSTYCIRCHSVNLSGGQVGPELNIPKNITEYFIEAELVGFILNAPAYRSGTKMPSFEKILDRQQAEAIVTYLKQMKNEKSDTK